MGMHAKPQQTTAPTQNKPHAKSKAEAAVDTVRIEKLLALEAEVRKCQSLKQLQFLIANETNKLIAARQSVVMHGNKKLAIVTISSLAILDNTSPTLRWLEKSLAKPAQVKSEQNADGSSGFGATLSVLDGSSAPDSNWPFCQTMHADLPLGKNAGLAKMVFLGEKEFTQADLAMADRLADTYGHAWNALVGSRISLSGIFSRKIAIASALIAAVMMFVPVTMTVLAPVEIIARDPVIVAAPLNGVIGSIEIDPNTNVKKGDVLFSYTPTDLENELEIADQTVEIARSRYRRASQEAFGTGSGRREMAELKSELDLALAKFNYAKNRLELSRVRAQKDGVILFSDKDDWVGKPVSTGEKIMRIANPEQTEFLIKLSVSDSIILEDGDEARIFLDADPLNPVAAKIVRRSFHAKPDEMNNFSYELIAQSIIPPQSNASISHRIGVRGTSQLFGKKVPLALFLFRKPLSAARQYLGL